MIPCLVIGFAVGVFLTIAVFLSGNSDKPKRKHYTFHETPHRDHRKHYTVHETLHRDHRKLGETYVTVYEIREDGRFIFGVSTHADYTNNFNARAHAANIAWVLNREVK